MGGLANGEAQSMRVHFLSDSGRLREIGTPMAGFGYIEVSGHPSHGHAQPKRVLLIGATVPYRMDRGSCLVLRCAIGRRLDVIRPRLDDYPLGSGVMRIETW